MLVDTTRIPYTVDMLVNKIIPFCKDKNREKGQWPPEQWLWNAMFDLWNPSGLVLYNQGELQCNCANRFQCEFVYWVVPSRVCPAVIKTRAEQDAQNTAKRALQTNAVPAPAISVDKQSRTTLTQSNTRLGSISPCLA